MAQRRPRDVSPNPNGETTAGANLESAAVPARPLGRLLPSPLAILLGTLALFFAAETFVMLVVFHPLISDGSPLVGAVIDSSVMASLSAPILWWLISRSHRAARAIAESEARYRSLTENTFDLVLETGVDGRFTYVSPNFRDALGYEPEELLGTSVFEPMHPDDMQEAMQEFSRAMTSNTCGAATFRFRHKNGEWRWLEAVGKPFPAEQGESRAVIISRDVTERKQADDELRALNRELEDERNQIKEMNLSLAKRVRERTENLEALNTALRERNRQLLDARSQAATDALTSLPNHRSFHERIRAEVKRTADGGSSIGLIMLDIDGFKNFNDSLGHLAGDGVLRHCADILVDTLGNDPVFRYGGDEFAVILAGADEARALQTAERLRGAIEAPDGTPSGVTVSLGVAAIPDTATTAENLIYKADAAMYQAKSAGKNRVARSSDLAAATDGPRPEATQAAVHRRGSAASLHAGTARNV